MFLFFFGREAAKKNFLRRVEAKSEEAKSEEAKSERAKKRRAKSAKSEERGSEERSYKIVGSEEAKSVEASL